MYFFLDNQLLIGLLILVFTVVWAFFIVRENNILKAFVPPMLLLALFSFLAFNDLDSLKDEFQVFCEEKGFTDSQYKTTKESYCLGQENGYLIEQEVREINGEWLFVKSSLSGDSDE